MLLNNIRRILPLACAGASLVCLAPFHASAATPPNAVYVMTNESSGNNVLVYSRSAAGKLTPIQTISTQGLGSGGNNDPLASQGALTMNAGGTLLLAVNAGSNQVTSFTITPTGLTFNNIVSSGGSGPVSVAISGSHAFVVNHAGTPNISEYSIATNGKLTLMPGSRALPGGLNAAPGQISVTPDGKVVVVTEKMTNLIDLFPLTAGGHVASIPSNNIGPFGFAFGPSQSLIVTEAINSTISSYSIAEGTNPSMSTITDSLPDTGGTACWIAMSPDLSIAYVINSMSRTISTLAVSPTGQLSLIQAVAANGGVKNGLIDVAITHDGKFLYVESSTTGLVEGYAVNGGTLTPIGVVTGLPISIQGIAAR